MLASDNTEKTQLCSCDAIVVSVTYNRHREVSQNLIYIGF